MERRNMRLAVHVHGVSTTPEQSSSTKVHTLDVPFGCKHLDLAHSIANHILGPEEERWSVVGEERKEELGPDGGGTVDITQTWRADAVTLHAHPGDDCCPMWAAREVAAKSNSMQSESKDNVMGAGVVASDLVAVAGMAETRVSLPMGPDVYGVMLGQYSTEPISNELRTTNWWRGLPSTHAATRRAAMQRLVTKAKAYFMPCAPTTAGATITARLLALEAACGLWEMSCERSMGQHMSGEALEALLAILRNNPPHATEDPINNTNSADANGLEGQAAAAEGNTAVKQPAAASAAVEQVGHASSQPAADAAAPANSAERCIVVDSMAAASAAVWHLCTIASTRAALLRKGVLPALVTAFGLVTKWREDSWQVTVIPPTRCLLPEGQPASTEFMLGAEGTSYASTDDVNTLHALNAVAYNVLGAFNVLAIDAAARDECLALSPSLAFLTHAAMLDFPVLFIPPAPPPPPPPLNGLSTFGEREGEQAKMGDDGMSGQGTVDIAAQSAAAAATAISAAGVAASVTSATCPDPTASSPGAVQLDPPPSTAVADVASASLPDDNSFVVEDADHGSESGFDAELQGSDGCVASVAPPPPAPQPDAVDDPRMHQRLAAEALYSMLARGRAVRSSFAAHGGMKTLGESLLHSRHPDVVACALSSLAAYSRDTAPSHTAGLDALQATGLAGPMQQLLSELLLQLLQAYQSGARVWGGAQSTSPALPTSASAVAAGSAPASMTGAEQVDQDALLACLMEVCATALWGMVLVSLRSAAAGGGDLCLGCENVTAWAALASGVLALLPGWVEEQEAAVNCNSQQLSSRTRTIDEGGANPSHNTAITSILAPDGPDTPAHMDGDELGGSSNPLPNDQHADTNHSILSHTAAHLPAPARRTNPLAGTLYCIVSCLGAVHGSPLLLAQVHSQLIRMHMELQSMHADRDMLLHQLQKPDKPEPDKVSSSNTMGRNRSSMRRLSSTYARELSPGEEEERQAKIKAQLAALSEEEEQQFLAIEGVESALQLASEDSVSLVQSILALPHTADGVGGRHVRHLHLVAAGVALSMARSSHPGRTLSAQEVAPFFQGPYGGLLHDADVLPQLTALAMVVGSTGSNDVLTHHTKQVVASGMMHLTCIEHPLPHEHLQLCLDFIRAASAHGSSGQYLAPTLWNLSRMAANRKAILKSSDWLDLHLRLLQPVLVRLRQAAELAEAEGSSRLPGMPTIPPSSVTTAASPYVRTARFLVMSVWLLLRQWLQDNLSPINNLGKDTDGLYSESNTSWWSVRFSLLTPLQLTPQAEASLMLLVQVLQLADVLPEVQALKDLTSKCVWNLSSAHTGVAGHLLSLGSGALMMTTCKTPAASSAQQQTAAAHAMQLVDQSPEHASILGGLTEVCHTFAMLIRESLSSGDAAGTGADIPLLEIATRGLARIALTAEGRAAMRSSHAVHDLISVVRADCNALQRVVNGGRLEGCRAGNGKKRNGGGGGVAQGAVTAEMLSPLRAVNGLSVVLSRTQQASLDILQGNSHSQAASHSSSMVVQQSSSLLPQGSNPFHPQHVDNATSSKCVLQSAPAVGHTHLTAATASEAEVGVSPAAALLSAEPQAPDGNAEAGLMALWALLNMSGYEPAQVSICKHGLYTLLRVVHGAVDPGRRSATSAILSNIHYHPQNATILYKAELKLKHAALVRIGNGPSRQQRQTHLAAHYTGGNTGGADLQRVSDGGSVKGAYQSSASPRKPSSMHAAVGEKLEQLAGVAAGLLRDSTVSPGANKHHMMIKEATAAAMDSTFLYGDRGLDMSQEDLLQQLTVDPDELTWLQQVGVSTHDAIEEAANKRCSMGTFLRGTFARSLAEGAHSLWAPGATGDELAGTITAAAATTTAGHGTFGKAERDANKPLSTSTADMPGGSHVHAHLPQQRLRSAIRVAGAPLVATTAHRPQSAAAQRSTTLTTMIKQGSPLHGSRAASPSPKGLPGLAQSIIPASCAATKSGIRPTTAGPKRPTTAPAVRGGNQANGAAHAAGHNSRRPSSSITRPSTVRQQAAEHMSTSSPAGGMTKRPTSAVAWSPHILAYQQDPTFDQPRTYLAQRLLTAAVPSTITHQLTDLTTSLFSSTAMQQGGGTEAAAAAAAAATAAAAAAQAELAAGLNSALFAGLSLLSPLDEVDELIGEVSSEGNAEQDGTAAVAEEDEQQARQLEAQLRQEDASREEAAWAVKERRRVHVTPSIAVASHPPPPPPLVTEAFVTCPIMTAPPSASASHRQSLASMSSRTLTISNSMLQRPESPAAVTHSTAVAAGTGSRRASMASSNSRPSSAHPGRPSSAHPARSNSNASSRGVTTVAPTVQAAVTKISGDVVHPPPHHLHHHRLASTSSEQEATGPLAMYATLDPSLKAALQRPRTGYRNPHVGLTSRPTSGALASSPHSISHFIAAGDSSDRPPTPSHLLDDVPRPVTVLGVGVDALLAQETARAMAEAAKAEEALRPACGTTKDAKEGGCGGVDLATELDRLVDPLLQPMPLSLLVATGDGGPDRLYKFPRDLEVNPRHMCLFEHVEGCRFCTELYGHYLLPSGALAHFYLGDAVVKGHRVDEIPAPAVPFGPEDWLPGGFPAARGLEDYLLPGRPAHLLGALPCPIPALGPRPTSWHLEWADDAPPTQERVRQQRETVCSLELQSVALKAVLVEVSRVTVETQIVEPRPPPPPLKKKGRPGMRAVTGSRPAAGPAKAAPPPSPTAARKR